MPRAPVARRALTAALGVLALAGAPACDDDDIVAPPAAARVRVLHASPDAGPVDIVVDGATARAGLQYTQIVDYAALPAGQRTFNVRPAGTATNAITVAPTLAAGADYTVIARGRIASTGNLALGALLLADDAAPASGRASLRVVHAAPGAPAVDIYLTAPNADLAAATPAVSNLAFGAATPYLSNVAPGTYQVRVTPAGTRTVAINVPSVTLAASQVRTAVAVGEGTAAAPLTALLLADRN